MKDKNEMVLLNFWCAVSQTLWQHIDKRKDQIKAEQKTWRQIHKNVFCKLFRQSNEEYTQSDYKHYVHNVKKNTYNYLCLLHIRKSHLSRAHLQEAQNFQVKLVHIRCTCEWLAAQLDMKFVIEEKEENNQT